MAVKADSHASDHDQVASPRRSALRGSFIVVRSGMTCAHQAHRPRNLWSNFVSKGRGNLEIDSYFEGSWIVGNAVYSASSISITSYDIDISIYLYILR